MLQPRDPKDDICKRTTHPSSVLSALLLTDIADTPSLGVEISNWTADERAEAFEWAMREHLHASDNDDVVRFARPNHVAALKTDYDVS